MGSRIRENVQHFFECFCEVVPPSAASENGADVKDAWIIQQYPYTYKDEEVLKSVSKFAYPYKFENVVIQHYSFVLTDIESKWTFGFCRHDPRSETAIVVLSYLPWHQAFYKFLDNIAVLMHSRDTESLNEFLSTVYKTRLTGPGKKFTIPFNKGLNTFTVDCPQPIAYQLPSIPENRNLTEYYNAVDTMNMMIVFASMLYERRIIFTSKKLTRLSACVQSANDLLYPMIWQHIFIPVLPMAFRDYLLAPMPFLIGVPDEVMKEVSRSDIGDVVILDADNNTIETPFDDLHNLPTEVVNSLKKQLKNKSALLGDGVSRAFLRALVQLIGGYRDALSFGDKATFDENKFFETRPSSLQPFLKEMLHLQIFRQFIEERLEILGAGLGFTDEFETEVSIYSEKSSSKLKQQYKEWTSTMKKEGTAFFKNVKDKANPAVKSAVKTVKDSGKGMKSAYKGLRSKLKDNPSRQMENGLETTAFDKPRSAPNSPTGKRRQLPSFSVPANTYRKDASLSLKSAVLERSYSPLSPLSQPISPDALDHSNTDSPSLDIPQMDLMTEMKDLLKLRLETPPVDRSLKPVRSLENFKTAPQMSPPYSPGGDRWTTFPVPSPPSRLFLPALKSSQDTQNLLLQSPDDVFSSPPVPPRPPLKPASQKDLFGSTAAPFVVGGGRGENGRPVFLVANDHRVDVVRLSPPTNSPRRKKQDDTEDLIRLDSSSSDMDDFDPLKSTTLSTSMPNSTSTTFNFQFDTNESRDYNRVPISVTNPLYNYENHHINNTNGLTALGPGGNSTVTPRNNTQFLRSSDRETVDLLQEYGLDFSRFSGSQFDGFGSVTNDVASKVSTKKEWTKFE